MATKKTAPKKVVKATKPAAKPAKKVVPVKPQPKAAAKPVKKSAPAKPQPKVKVIATKPTKQVAKVTKPAAKPATKAVPAKPQPKAKVVAPKPAVKPVVKPVAKPVAKPTKVAKVVVKPTPKKQVKETPIKASKPEKAAKPEKVAKVEKPAAPTKPSKTAKFVKPMKVPVKISGIEKSTTVIPMKQKPMKKKEEPVKEMKAPKILLKTSVPYNPGYTPLDKRVETNKPNSPLVKYSDSELNEFRDLINKKLDAAKKELAYFQGLITRKDDSGGDNGDGRYMTMEDGSLSMEREQLSQMASRTITYIDHLEKAIMRIENKTYGICRVTGKLIDKARLRAVPHATLSLEAKLGLVKPNGE